MRKMDTRNQLKDAFNTRERLDAQIERLTDEYLEEFEGEHVVWITDHAIVRYIERILGMTVPESELGEKDRVAKWFSKQGVCPETFRNGILTLDEQQEIIRKRKSSYVKSGFRYLIKNLALISIIPIKPKKDVT